MCTLDEMTWEDRNGSHTLYYRGTPVAWAQPSFDDKAWHWGVPQAHTRGEATSLEDAKNKVEDAIVAYDPARARVRPAV